MIEQEWLDKIAAWKDTLTEVELELFYKATDLARKAGERRYYQRDVLDMD